MLPSPVCPRGKLHEGVAPHIHTGLQTDIASSEDLLDAFPSPNV